ncbi:MAG: insulinase family protein [Lachnospiraceae bacterium]|jgi:Zn-dependent M16 (insulinase) family peptidase|nr:insulinase family protein [Lachnospiraceae bacterium]
MTIPSAYETLTDRHLADQNARGLLLKHKKTGARVVLLLNDDDNKVFCIGFRTPPPDSTGVPHILEHSVLCGSERFPTKDPFIELVKGSLNTFLNAMTYPDKTVYPVASCNDQDFANLMHVYLDAVFFPNIYKEEKIFLQEGWHYEVDAESGALTYNGVVYNEMKGAFSTPDDVVEREIYASLAPDGTYGLEAGGDPEAIPDLTYEQFLDFHRRYYHPSNSYIYLYGDLDVEERLRFIDEEYLSRFERLEIDSTIKMQKAFAAPVRLTREYPLMEGEGTGEKTYLTYNIGLIDGASPKEYLAFQVLDYALCAAQGAALKQALLDRRLGKDIYSAMEMGVAQPFYSVIAKDGEAEREEEFVAAVEEVLAGLSANGLDKKALLAGLNLQEFRYREADYGQYPRGLILGLTAFDSWLYDDNNPFVHLEALPVFAELRTDIAKGYFENLSKEHMLSNPHKAILKVVPVPGLIATREEALAKKLAWQRAGLGEQDLQALKDKAAALKAFQEAPDTEEDIRKIPMLTRADMKAEARPFVNRVENVGDTTVLFHDVYTNGIAYLGFIFDVRETPADLYPYLAILKAALALVDTENYGFADLFNEINIQTGGLAVAAGLYQDANERTKYRATLEINVKVLYENIDKAFALVREILLTSNYHDDKRLYEIIAETKSKMETAMQSGGHSVAAIRALSYQSEAAAHRDHMSGIAAYRLVADLETNFNEKKGEIAHKLTALAAYLFQPSNFMLDCTAGEVSAARAVDNRPYNEHNVAPSINGETSVVGEGQRCEAVASPPAPLGGINAQVKKNVRGFFDAAPVGAVGNRPPSGETSAVGAQFIAPALDCGETSDGRDKSRPYEFTLRRRNEGFATAGQVQFVCRAGNFAAAGLPYTGALRALKVMMGYEYLWTQIRVLGGAYGCMNNFAWAGDAYFVSYRDPHLARTVEVFTEAPAFVAGYEADERSLTQFIIGAIGDLDVPLTPAMKGAYGLGAYMSNMSFAQIQKERDELLALDAETLRGLSRYIEAFIRDECFCVVGAEEKIKENEGMFGEVTPLIG